MSSWSQVYDDDRALGEARGRARRLLIGFAVVSGTLVSAAPVAALTMETNGGAVALGCGALLVISAAVVVVQLAREHRRLWRVELSVGRLVGHDAAGRRRSMAWTGVERVDVSGQGLVVTGTDDSGTRGELVVAASMPAFSALAHRAVEYAEAHGRVVCVEGCPVDLLDLVTLYPALCETAGSTA